MTKHFFLASNLALTFAAGFIAIAFLLIAPASQAHADTAVSSCRRVAPSESATYKAPEVVPLGSVASKAINAVNANFDRLNSR